MKYLNSILVVALAVIIFSSCKKEGPAGPQGPTGPTGPTGNTSLVDPALYGKWAVQSGLTGTSYLIIKDDNITYRLDSAAYGFKRLYTDMAFVTSSQIKIFGIVYNYTISNNTLYLSNLNSNIVLTKNDNAPDETEWVTYVNVIDSIVSPNPTDDGRQDIGFDGTNILWTTKSSSNTLYKINPVTHAVTTLTLSGTYYYSGALYASSSLWLSDQNVIYKVNPTTGAVISTSPTLCSSTITGLALYGDYMFYSDWSGHVYYWDITGSTVYPFFDRMVNGMEYVGGYLYLAYGNMVYKCQMSPFKCVQTYYVDSPLAGSNNGGITFDGANFWIAGYSYDTDEYKLVKLDM